MPQNVLIGLGSTFQPLNLAIILGGIVAGMGFGALPGFSATMAVAVLVPVTYWVPPESGLLLLGAIFCGAIYGGSIPAILLKIPGTPASVPTTFDGFAMTRKGKGAEALGISTFGSALGGALSGVIMLFFAPLLAAAALYFGPPEVMCLAVFGLSVVSTLSPGALIKGLIVCLFGLLAATVGMDPVEGYPRLTFGMFQLMGGLPLVPVLIGLFSLPPIVRMAEEGLRSYMLPKVEGPVFLSWPMFKRTWRIFLRSSLIGIGVGIVPVAGPEIAAFVAYNDARRISRDPVPFGSGNIDGLAAPEAANCGATGGSLIPLFTLGIPGSAPAALFLGAMMIHGLRPGPMIFEERADIGYTVMVGFIVTNVLMYFVGAVICRFTLRVVRLPQTVLGPVILTLTTVGAYAVGGTMTDVYVMWAAGVTGFVLERLGFPLSPICLALILGPILEAELIRTLVMFNGNLWLVFTRPIAVLLFALAVVMFFGPLVAGRRAARA
ncbi:MAG: tripartite tricarboxylate transporter permease [Planctomycetota bacterium]|jgi:putative tricarboxylic transport membrane protein|nr:tripartite tricarboxylate transporter permease [Planctomycetota bacterium]